LHSLDDEIEPEIDSDQEESKATKTKGKKKAKKVNEFSIEFDTGDVSLATSASIYLY
jgi:hypothetical protein